MSETKKPKWADKPGVSNGHLIDKIIAKQTTSIEHRELLGRARFGSLTPFSVNKRLSHMKVASTTPVIMPYEDEEELMVPPHWKQERIDKYIAETYPDIAILAPLPEVKPETATETPKAKKPKGLKGALEYDKRK